MFSFDHFQESKCDSLYCSLEKRIGKTFSLRILLYSPRNTDFSINFAFSRLLFGRKHEKYVSCIYRNGSKVGNEFSTCFSSYFLLLLIGSKKLLLFNDEKFMNSPLFLFFTLNSCLVLTVVEYSSE